ncbi:zinc ribbon domain-containing protein [Candidatus Bathyarchaeota archaeon]|nr:MAG: zinc ribbon domain-containing protein [Candidatus Bathyarchaeota archaeon]
MPNYHYRCCHCRQVTVLNLPISTDPTSLQGCECGYTMRRMISSTPAFNGFKVWAGDWFKKIDGQDIAEGAYEKVREREEYDKNKRELEADGVRITHQSRQVGGDDRIKIPDKRDD